MGSTFQIGKQHIDNGIVCHDRAIAVKDGGLTILALSDGMGHPEFRCPDLGAQFAVNFIRENAVEIHELLDGLSKGDDGKAVWNQNDGEKQFVEKLVRILQRMQDGQQITHIASELELATCTVLCPSQSSGRRK